ncbi:D-ribose pyranase [Actinobacteria bacterium YIM 96077]|uniref:D-ribose pyranase n=1 Tax=Phytoactinopolyspora halophila TaxID=1981511 RepID=A0A329QW75_9ACTN|nr:D-ribose pyranase [Phytoactinopolyspora halophila]AYY13895.1 D-ribose pyranase [Actinobacteria bacterium YIM 96077]RAW15562.1 D-ribose pyranase [Phytoactinopolyspora halophila]
MKDHGILHPRLSAVVTAMGHGDTLCVADAGLPVPPGVERIDLAFAAGQPRFIDVVEAVLAELRVEAYTIADESLDHSRHLVDHVRQRLHGAEELRVSHDVLKEQTRAVRAVVRTGEFTPFANVVLRSGVAFPVSQ